MPAIVMAQVRSVAHVRLLTTVQRLAAVGRAATHANPGLPIMARFAARM